jgi:hypothetical protein
MTAIPSRQRNRLLAALLCGVGAAALLPISVVYGARSLLTSSSGSRVDDSAALKIPATPAALLASINDVNQVTSLTVFVLDPSGIGGTVVSLPVGSRAEQVGNEDPRRVGDSYAIAGIEGLTLEVEGLLDVTFGVAETMNAEQLTTAFAGLPDVQVTFDVPLINTSVEMPPPPTTVRSSATTVVPEPIVRDNEVYPAGTSTISANELPIVLLAQRFNEPESVRLPRIKSMWEGVAVAVGGEVIAPDVATSAVGQSVPQDLATFMNRVFGGRMQVWQMGYAALAGADNPTSVDLYALDVFEVRMIMASVAPSSLSVSSELIAVQLDSPFNDANVTRSAVERLSYVGLSVALIREIAVPPDSMTVFYYSDGAIVEVAQRQLEDVIGPTSFQPIKQAVEGIAARVVLGASFVEFLKQNPPLPTTVPPAQDES